MQYVNLSSLAVTDERNVDAVDSVIGAGKVVETDGLDMAGFNTEEGMCVEVEVNNRLVSEVEVETGELTWAEV